MSDFQIEITPGLTAADTKAKVVGEIPAPAIALDPYAWGGAVVLANGGVNSPLFHRFLPIVHLGSVATKVIATKVTVQPPDITPRALAHKLWDNSDNANSGHYEASLTASVSSSDSVGWSRSTNQQWTAGVSVEVGGGPVKAGASSSYSVTVETGHSVDHSVTRSIDSEDSLSEELPPYSAAVAILLIQSGSVNLMIDFEVAFSGGPVKWSGRAGVGGGPTLPYGQNTVEELLPHLPAFYKLQNTMHQSIDFFRDTTSKIVSIPDGSDASIDAGIKKAVAEMTIPKPTKPRPVVITL